MAKLSLADLTNITGNETSAISTINSNHTAIETALENTLSRDGTSPNTMEADLDMNSNNILNLPYPASDTEPVRLGDIEDLLPTWFSQNSAPATTEPEGSLWIDADSTDKDIYQLVGGVWTDTGINIKGEQGATGATGAAGANGSNGTNGTDGTSVGVDYTYSTTTADADPGAGIFRLNNATISSVTQGYFDNTDIDGNTVTSWLDSFDDSTNTTVKGLLYIRGVDDPTDFAVFNVTGTVTDGTGYRKVTLAHLASGGTWTNAQRFSINFAPSGDKGADGAGSGDVVGPASATDNAIVRFDSTAGKLIQNSAVTIADTTGVMTGAVFPNTGLKVQDTNASHNLSLVPGSDLTADHTLTLTTGDADRTLTISGNATVSQNYSTSGSPQFTGIELGHATDTTITRTGAGAIAVEGVAVALNSTSLAHTASTIELGHATDTTLSRSSAGVLAVEGVTVSLNSTSATHTAGTIELGAATDTTLSRASAGVLAVEGVNVLTTGTGVAQGKHTVWIPAGACKAKVTSGAAAGSYDSGSNDVTITTFDFDTTTQEYLHTLPIGMPKSWNESTVTAQVYWTNAGGASTQTVRWTVAGAAVSDDDTLNTTFGTAVNIDDTWLAQNDLHISAESSAITIGGTPAEGDLVIFQVSRDVANDNMAGDALFIGMKLFITTNASTDA